MKHILNFIPRKVRHLRDWGDFVLKSTYLAFVDAIGAAVLALQEEQALQAEALAGKLDKGGGTMTGDLAAEANIVRKSIYGFDGVVLKADAVEVHSSGYVSRYLQLYADSSGASTVRSSAGNLYLDGYFGLADVVSESRFVAQKQTVHSHTGNALPGDDGGAAVLVSPSGPVGANYKAFRYKRQSDGVTCFEVDVDGNITSTGRLQFGATSGIVGKIDITTGTNVHPFAFTGVNAGAYMMLSEYDAGRGILTMVGVGGKNLRVDANTRMMWGGSFDSYDTYLYRSAVNALKTDGTFEATEMILTDRTTETRYRVFVDNGVLGLEAA